MFAVGGLASAGVVTFVAPFALQHHIDVVRGFFVAYTVTALAMRIGAARVTDRLGHRRVALAGCAGYGLVMVVMGGAGPGHLILLGAAFGVAHGVLYPALMALVIGDLPADRRPRALAFTNGAINLGVAGVGVLGTIAEHTGYPAVFVVTGRPRSRRRCCWCGAASAGARPAGVVAMTRRSAAGAAGGGNGGAGFHGRWKNQDDVAVSYRQCVRHAPEWRWNA